MKIRRFKSLQGNTLVLTVVVTGLIGFLLAAYLGLVKSQNVAVMRSQAWNASIPVIEAGIEDALTHINIRLTNDLTGDGWEKRGNIYITERWIGPDRYVVTISNWVVGMVSNSPVIESRGFVAAPLMVASAPGPFFAIAGPSLQPSQTNQQYVARGIRCDTRQDWLFSKGMVAKGQIDLRGKNIMSDSFDSSDVNYSTNGLYDPTRHKDNGDIATNSGLTNSLNVGNAQIYGHVSTGPGGSIAIGPQGRVGDSAWHEDNATQGRVKPGWSTDDMNIDFQSVRNPYTGGLTPSAKIIDGVLYKYVLEDDTDYYMFGLTLNAGEQMLVTGDARLRVLGDIQIGGTDAAIIIQTNASLQLFAFGANTAIAGNGVVNQAGNALDFQYWGMPNNRNLSYGGNATFTGTIYAPEADFTLNGSGNNVYDFIGASITKSVAMNGHFRFHYDEALRKYGPPRGYVVTTWNEMTPYEVANGPTY